MDLKNKNHASLPILVGTSGYAYSEWVDAGFYPPGTGTARMLGHYTRVFPITEINYTWYQMPKAPAMDRMRRRLRARLGRSETQGDPRRLSMRIYEGSPRQDYEEVLRSIGAFVDQRGLHEILLAEAPDGFIVQGIVGQTQDSSQWSDPSLTITKETYTFLDEDIARFLEDSQARRRTGGRHVGQRDQHEHPEPAQRGQRHRDGPLGHRRQGRWIACLRADGPCTGALSRLLQHRRRNGCGGRRSRRA